MPDEGKQQLLILAKYSDGSIRDVTRITQFESNEPVFAKVSATGLVTTVRVTDSVSIMARFQSQVEEFRSTVPLGSAINNLPETKTLSDKLVFKKPQQLGLLPSAPANDFSYICRVIIDIAGRLSTKEESLEFLTSTSETKRDDLVELLLDSSDYADYFREQMEFYSLRSA